MKKQLLVLALISVTQVVTPEWREHQGFLGGLLNTSEAIVEAPAEIVSPSYRDEARNRSEDRRERRNQRRNQRRNSDQNSNRSRNRSSSRDTYNRD